MSSTRRRRSFTLWRNGAAIVFCGLCLAALVPADDGEGEGDVQITFMRDRPIFVRLHEREVEEGGRKAKQRFYAIVNDGEAELTEAIVARWTTGLANFITVRQEAESRLMQLLNTVRTQAALTDEQFDKLTLAGRGDLSRFVDECEAVYVEHRGRKVSWAKVQDLSPRCQDLRDRFTGGLHREGSLFRKLLATMLAPSELERVIGVLENRPRGAARLILDVF